MAAGLLFCLGGSIEILRGGTSDWNDLARGAFMLVFGAFALWRGYLSATVIITDETVVLRSAFATRRLPLATIGRASLDTGNTGLSGHGRQYLVVSMHDGSTVRFKELNARPPHVTGPQTVVERCVAAINHAASPPPSR